MVPPRAALTFGLVLFAVVIGTPPGVLDHVAASLTPHLQRSSGDPLGAGPVTVEEARQRLAEADELYQRDEYQAALDRLAPLLAAPQADIATEAAYRAALVRLALSQPAEAVALLEQLLGRGPADPVATRAQFLLGRARREAGDCSGALAAFSQYLQRTKLLEGYAHLQMADCHRQLGDRAAALDQSAQAAQVDGPRLLRIDALERQADLLEQAGDLEAARARYVALIDLARAPEYGATVRMAAARLSEQLGDTPAAIDQLAAIVEQLPSTRGAVQALDHLGELQAQDHVSFYAAGLVRFSAGDYERAIGNFDGALATPAEADAHPAAAFYRAVARVRLGAEGDGVQDLLALPGRYPASSYAPTALLRAGLVLESNGQLADAAAAYARLTRDYPASEATRDALHRLGLLAYIQADYRDAADAWNRLAAAGGSADQRALALFWAGKAAARGGDTEGARRLWQQAADLAPRSYGGARARDVLDGRAEITMRPSALDLARLDPSTDELNELSAWMAQRGLALADARAEQAADPSFQRLTELLALGLPTEAGWEVDALIERFQGDAARLTALALALRERGQVAPALRAARLALEAAHATVSEAPTGLFKLLYPLPYAAQLKEQAERFGVDPLLLAALIRQESQFNPRARSPANALGLTQVVPSTGQEIARALGRSDFQPSDLLHPAVSLEFGAYYLGQRLTRYGGALVPALAGYNAGDGPVQRWLQDFGAEDPDLFAERIPYAETSRYVRLVYENYANYAALYGRQG